MSFEIHATDNGPVIINNDEVIVLTSEAQMLELCHEDPSCFSKIENHIQDELRSASETYLDGFISKLNPPAGRLYAYIAAVQQYWMFRNIKFAQYLEAIQNSEEE